MPNKYGRSWGLDWHVVRYETLVADLAGQTRTICAFLGIEEVPGMGDFAQRVSSREHATPSTAQLARGLDASGIDQWRRYEAQLAPVLALLEPGCGGWGTDKLRVRQCPRYCMR